MLRKYLVFMLTLMIAIPIFTTLRGSGGEAYGQHMTQDRDVYWTTLFNALWDEGKAKTDIQGSYMYYVEEVAPELQKLFETEASAMLSETKSRALDDFLQAAHNVDEAAGGDRELLAALQESLLMDQKIKIGVALKTAEQTQDLIGMDLQARTDTEPHQPTQPYDFSQEFEYLWNMHTSEFSSLYYQLQTEAQRKINIPVSQAIQVSMNQLLSAYYEAKNTALNKFLAETPEKSEDEELMAALRESFLIEQIRHIKEVASPLIIQMQGVIHSLPSRVRLTSANEFWGTPQQPPLDNTEEVNQKSEKSSRRLQWEKGLTDGRKSLTARKFKNEQVLEGEIVTFIQDIARSKDDTSMREIIFEKLSGDVLYRAHIQSIIDGIQELIMPRHKALELALESKITIEQYTELLACQHFPFVQELCKILNISGTKDKFILVPSLQQMQQAGHDWHCAYYALYNASRFIEQMPVICATAAAPYEQALALSRSISDRTNFATYLTPWENQIKIHRLIKYQSDATNNLSEQEITEVLCSSGTTKMYVDNGQLVLFGSVSDLVASVSEDQFMFNRIGKAMQAVQRGLPVSFVLNLGVDHASSMSTHFVTVGLQKIDTDIVIYAMDSYGNHFSPLRTILAVIAGFMQEKDPIKCAIKTQLTPLWKDVIKFFGEEFSAPDDEEFTALVHSRCHPKILELLAAFPERLEQMKETARTVFSELDKAAKSGTAYTDAVIEILDDAAEHVKTG